MIELSGSQFLAIAEALEPFVFAVSGAMAAIQNRYDLFGILVLAFATAIGGGTIRDILVGNLPVSWSVFAGFFFTITLHRHIQKLQSWIFFFDAVGLVLFTVMGVQVGLNLKWVLVIRLLLEPLPAVLAELSGMYYQDHPR